METTRKHPDLFTAAEALEYLHLNGNEHTLQTLREKGLLTGWKPGREFVYHRRELDALIVLGFPQCFVEAQRPQPESGPRLRIGGQRV